MATFDLSRPVQPVFGSSFSNLFGSVLAWYEHRATVRSLQQLSDRELDDVGLTRETIAQFGDIRR
ncbi:DUF1127 domain-containing protein [Jannaschia sp. M317]|uniref:DUF1127 domain-containing protein n=1 Tax=Jannaschia sp. M317 TaxID=2867011 RepID=UPI0021A896F7|nr:DUF1127 domain-containing protein [Jannaschia sp. M317]UWQ17565.1 DUF1127 domain-containing protein [Jannaschia sp. M317]